MATLQSIWTVFFVSVCIFGYVSFSNGINVIQYGPLRTATTAQYQAICTAMAAKHSHELELLNISFQGKNELVWTNNTIFLSPGMINIVKVHDLPLEPTFRWPPPADDLWVFTSTIEGGETLSNLGYNVKFAASITWAKANSGIQMMEKYAELVGLDQHQTSSTCEFFRYFAILRICCGRQMSQDWRQNLSARAVNAQYRRHHSQHGRGYPACEMYDIDTVERLFIGSELAVLIRASNNHYVKRMVRPSLMDGELDGAYCSRYNDAVQKRHLKFNHPM
eukprot:m.22255 g.22255  ORF g.22255 m.22255 type:complete len:278 (-) comp13751_c0_seq1:210-1043(-)